MREETMSRLVEFIDYLKVHKRYSPRTLDLYQGYITDFYDLVQHLGEEDELGPLEPNVIRSYIASGLDSGLSPRTMNLKLSALSSYSNFLVKKGYIKYNPVKRVYRPKQTKNLPEFYTQGAVEHYFNTEEKSENFRSLRNRTVVATLYSTGLRRAELANLRISDWDTRRSVFRVIGKGDKLREIPVPETLHRELSAYLEKI